MIRTYQEYLTLLKEGLIKTYNVSYLHKMLVRWFEYYKIIYDIDVNKDTNDLQFNISNTNENQMKSIHTEIIRCGFFISVIIDKTIRKNYLYDLDTLNELDYNNNFYIQVERKFDDDILYNGILYHITLKNKLHKIKKIGLCPKTNNKISTHPDRIYLFDTINKCNNYINMIEEKEENKEKYYIITLKVENLKIYNDPNSDGYYTYDNIHPNKIQKQIQTNTKTNI